MLNKEILDKYQHWIKRCDRREDLRVLSEAEITDSFFRELTFGTGGLRGKLGLGPNRLNVYTVGKATQGLSDYLNDSFDNPTVALCRDTRHGSEEFVRRVAEVLAGNGIRSYLFDRVEPTPALSFAVRELGCSAGATSPHRTTPPRTTDTRSTAPTAARSPSRRRRPSRRLSTPSTVSTASRRCRSTRHWNLASCNGFPKGFSTGISMRRSRCQRERTARGSALSTPRFTA